MSGIMRIGFVHIWVNDLEESARFYEDVVGLERTGENEGGVYYKCWDEYDHHSLVLTKGPNPGIIRVGWKVACESDLSKVERDAERYGLTVGRVSRRAEPWIGEGVSFVTPSGHSMLFYNEIEQPGRAIKPPAVALHRDSSIGPPHLDHVFLTTQDPEETIRFFVSVLGFRLTEQGLDPDGRPVVAFLARTNTPHDVAFGKGPNGRYHHFAYYVDSWDDVLRTGRCLSDNGRRLEVTPSHHGATRGQTTYFRDPSGNRLETFAGGYKSYPDFPTITWGPEHLDRMLFYFGGPADPVSWLEPI